MIETVTNLDDPRLEPFRNLPEKTLLHERGLVIAEGPWLVERLLASDLDTIAILAAERRRDDVAPLLPDDVPLYLAPDNVISEIVGYQFHTGVIAAARRPGNPPLDALLPVDPAAHATLLVCPRITNPDNLGSIFRSAAAFGASGILLGDKGSDPWRRKTVRVSMGAVFSLTMRVTADLHADLTVLRETHGVECVAAVLDDNAEPLATAHRSPRMAIMLGPEDFGLDEACLAHCDRHVTIPMGAGADSLNVAVAAAVFLYHFTCASRCT